MAFFIACPNLLLVGPIVPRVPATWQSDRFRFALHHFSITAKEKFHAERIKTKEAFLRVVLRIPAVRLGRPQGPLPRAGISLGD